MNGPLVSIIIPIYNSEKYLQKCIDKVLLQTYEDIQLILVDDGSTDGSGEICKSLTDQRAEYCYKQNGGASSARNEGLRRRRGKYVLFVDSDDALVPGSIETLVRAAEESRADCVYFEAENKAEDPSIPIKKNGLSQCRDYGTTDGNSLIADLLENKNYHAVPFLYFAKSELYDAGLSFEEGIMFEDELFSFRLLRECKKVCCLRQVLYYRNVRPGSVMTSEGKQLFRFTSITTVYERLYEDLPANRDDKVYSAYIARIAMLWLDYHEALSRNEKDEAKSVYRRIKGQILSENGFGIRELRIRCRSRLLWYAYIAPGRILKKIKRMFK